MIIIAFGANLHGRYGAPTQTYRRVLEELESHDVMVLRESSLWETAPVDTPDVQPPYINAVIAVQTTLQPEPLLDLMACVEKKFGRVEKFKNASRVIDLDLISYNDVSVDKSHLILPHPRMHRRAFVLLPLQEIAPDWIHPQLGKPLSEMIRELPPGQDAHILGEAA